MKLIRHGHDDRFDLWIGEHFIVGLVGDAGAVNSGHFCEQVFGDVANGIKFGITRFSAGLEMGDLRDRAYGLSWALLFAMLGAIGAVSIATPFLHVQYTQRWFVWPNIILTAPVPIAVVGVTVLLLRSLANKYDYQPFFLALALFASRDLPSWTERLGDGPVAERVQALAAEWDRAMAALGLAAPHEDLRSAIRRLLDWQWDSPPYSSGTAMPSTPSSASAFMFSHGKVPSI